MRRRVKGFRFYGMRNLPLLLVVLVRCGTAPAAEPVNRTIFQLQHTAWTAREGAPSPIFAITQTSDGYLWLGTSAGLYRFDGLRFEPYKPPSGKHLSSNDVTALYGTSDGGLWIGYRFGGADFLKNGVVTAYRGFPASDGFPSGSVRRFVKDRKGTLWAATYGDIGRFDGSKWQRFHKDSFYKWDSARDLFVDPKGTLWVANAQTIAFLPAGEKQFQQIAEPVDHPVRLAQAPNGTVWVLQEPGVDAIAKVRPITSPNEQGGRPFPWIGGAYSTWIFFDHAGNLWMTSIDGLLRVPAAELLKER